MKRFFQMAIFFLSWMCFSGQGIAASRFSHDISLEISTLVFDLPSRISFAYTGDNLSLWREHEFEREWGYFVLAGINIKKRFFSSWTLVAGSDISLISSVRGDFLFGGKTGAGYSWEVGDVALRVEGLVAGSLWWLQEGEVTLYNEERIANQTLSSDFRIDWYWWWVSLRPLFVVEWPRNEKFFLSTKLGLEIPLLQGTYVNLTELEGNKKTVSFFGAEEGFEVSAQEEGQKRDFMSMGVIIEFSLGYRW